VLQQLTRVQFAKTELVMKSFLIAHLLLQPALALEPESALLGNGHSCSHFCVERCKKPRQTSLTDGHYDRQSNYKSFELTGCLQIGVLFTEKVLLMNTSLYVCIISSYASTFDLCHFSTVSCEQALKNISVMDIN
jgi:hypothetical protein